MITTSTIVLVAFGYIGLLFAIAYYGRRRADMGRSIVSNPYIYALSLAVYCTAWTFYGSVGWAAQHGLGFLPIYLGPTLMAAMGWSVLRKIIRISKIHRITSIADFIASRYGKSALLGGAVTIIAVLGIIPYIALQLKAISTSFALISRQPDMMAGIFPGKISLFTDTAFYVTFILVVFSVLFGTRDLDLTERHEGLVTAIAFESLVKLIAAVSVGVFVTYGLFNGFQDLFRQAMAIADLRRIVAITLEGNALEDWSIYIFLSMMAVMFLPRQFQVAVVENVDENHLNKAIWLFPLYLLVINLFVLPLAFGGLLFFQGQDVDADFFALSLPMALERPWLALLVFIGGLSAATGMVIVETVALSTMICNQLVMPLLLRLPIPHLEQIWNLRQLVLGIRRAAIALVLMLGYAYFHFVGEIYGLVSIGLVSFAAVTQFAPSMLGGIFWKDGNRKGALWGLVAGFSVWIYTLVLPSMVQAGLLSGTLVEEGPFGIALLKPFALFGLTGYDRISHAIIWSMLANVGTYVTVSLFTRPTPIEHTQAMLFVNVFAYSDHTGTSVFWRGTASVPDLKSLLERFLGTQRTEEALADYARSHPSTHNQGPMADAGLVSYAEKQLAGVIGSASAHILVSSVVKEEPLGMDELMDILDEARQVITYSRKLEKVTSELRSANERLKELDRLKDEFISTVTHELRTPLTSVRALAEILRDNPQLDPERHQQFCAIIIRESERLTRLISQVLDFQKMEAGVIHWEMGTVRISDVIQEAMTGTRQLIEAKGIAIHHTIPSLIPIITGDQDRLTQVMVNLLSNAVKFCPDKDGMIAIEVRMEHDHLRVDVKDNGIGISRKNQAVIFEEFLQVKDSSRGRPAGSGLGLTITRRIIEAHQGRIWVKSKPGKGSVFSFTLPF